MSKDTGLWSVNPPDARTRGMRLLHQVWPSRCRRGSAFSIEECVDLMARFAEEQVKLARAFEKLAHDAISSQPCVHFYTPTDPAASTNIKTQPWNK